MERLGRGLVEVRDLRKTYKDGAEALKGIDLRIDGDAIVAVAGPNGAGKTTILRILATQLEATSGEVVIDGVDVLAHPRLVRKRIASAPQDASPDPLLTVREHVYYYLRVRGEARGDAHDQTERALNATGLIGRKDALVGRLSGGQRRRVLIAMAIASEARVLFLDEPTAGLDLIARTDVWRELRKLAGTTLILLTTHSMEEVAAIADRLIILCGGEVVLDDAPRALQASLPRREKIIIQTNDDAAFAGCGELERRGSDLVLIPDSVEHRERAIAECWRRHIPARLTFSGLEDAYLQAVNGHSVSRT